MAPPTDAETALPRTSLRRGRPLIPSPSPPGSPGEKGAGRIPATAAPVFQPAANLLPQFQFSVGSNSQRVHHPGSFFLSSRPESSGEKGAGRIPNAAPPFFSTPASFYRNSHFRRVLDLSRTHSYEHQAQSCSTWRAEPFSRQSSNCEISFNCWPRWRGTTRYRQTTSVSPLMSPHSFSHCTTG